MAYKKCILCGENILPTEDFVPYKGKFVHQRCFNVKIKQLGQSKKDLLTQTEKKKPGPKPKPKAELKEGLTEEEYAKKRKYYDYLKSLLKDDQLSAKQFAVSEKYIERYNFTFEGMYQTLVYLNEIVQKELVGDIIGIIPYYYNEALNFYQELEQINNINQDINLKKLYPVHIIKVNPKKRKIKSLDVEEIE